MKTLQSLTNTSPFWPPGGTFAFTNAAKKIKAITMQPLMVKELGIPGKRMRAASEVFAILLLTAIPLFSRAAELGMPAPPLKIAQWLRGKPVDLKQGAAPAVCVLVFWETWCNACSASMPHLTEIQKKYKEQGVVIVAISQESSNAITAFMATMGAKMDFTVAADLNRGTYDEYMKAFDEVSIPHAFVIDKSGTILWHRNPGAGLEPAIGRILDGTFDRETEKKAAHAEKLQLEYLTLARSNSIDAKAAAIGDEILRDGISNPWLLNNLAWAILTAKNVQTRDLGLATRAARAAFESSGRTNSAFADTYARALFDSGDIEQAINMETLAVDFCNEPRDRAYFQEALTRYKLKKHSVP